jgi:hypothetical protein
MITTNIKEIQGIIKDYFESISRRNGNFLHKYDHPKLNQEENNHLNRFITHNEIEAAIKSLPKKKRTGLDGLILQRILTDI